MKKLVITITLLITLVGFGFATDKRTKKFEEGVYICKRIAKDYNVDVEITKASALPNRAISVCMKKDEKFVIKLNWNYYEKASPDEIIPGIIHEMGHAVTGNCGHDQRWINAIFDIVDYFPNLNYCEAYNVNNIICE